MCRHNKPLLIIELFFLRYSYKSMIEATSAAFGFSYKNLSSLRHSIGITYLTFVAVWETTQTLCVIYQCEFLTYTLSHSHKSGNADPTVLRALCIRRACFKKPFSPFCPSCLLISPMVFSLCLVFYIGGQIECMNVTANYLFLISGFASQCLLCTFSSVHVSLNCAGVPSTSPASQETLPQMLSSLGYVYT